jgi:hypothetical protein
MEPTDLKNERPDDAQLEAWYRAHLTTHPLRDDGFSQRVLAVLPTSEKSSAMKRRWCCIGGAVIGAGVALIGFTTSGNLPTDLPAFRPDLADSLANLASPAFLLALSTAILSLWAVFRPQWRLLPRI